MTQRAISRAESEPLRVVIVTLDNHLAAVVRRAETALAEEIPGLRLRLHAASDWADNRSALDACLDDIGSADIIIATMLFMEDHIQAVLPALQARRDKCDAIVGALSAGEVIRLTRLGGFHMDAGQKGPIALLKRLRGSKTGSSGAGQMTMLRRISRILRFIPGGAQDLRAYFLTMQYWLSGSPDNVADMVRFLAGRYAQGARRALVEDVSAAPPRAYPDVGLYHPRAAGKIVERVESLPGAHAGARGTVGLVLLRSYVLAEDAGHYDGVIDALEAKGLRVIPAFATGLDARPAIDAYFVRDGKACVDAVISLAGFSLVGGPAYNDAAAAEECLAALDVPYISAQPLEFQSLERWGASSAGLSPVESTIMVAIPELDGATAPIVFGGRSDGSGQPCTGCTRGCVFQPGRDASLMRACPERAEMLAARTAKLVALRQTARRDRKVGIVLFNFPPNAGAAGSAAYLSVFASLLNTLRALKAEGYTVDAPRDVDALRDAILNGTAQRYGTDANVHARISAEDHVRREPHLAEIEAQWGPAPGRHLTDGRDLFILGARFGNVFVGLQPAFGIEGDPMRLMFEKTFAPTHAFSAFYRWLREDFGAHALLHFGTHGALEFMPGKQVGLSGADWPDRLIGDAPNVYLYAANNPTEGMIAKRRSAATLITYLTPPLAKAGLYQGLQDLKALIARWDRDRSDETLRDQICARAQEINLSAAAAQHNDGDAWIRAFETEIADIEATLIPAGLHTIGAPPSAQERADLLLAIAEGRGDAIPRAAAEALAAGATPEQAAGRAGKKSSALTAALRSLQPINAALATDSELPAVLRALDGGYIRPAPGGDLVRTPAVLPTGRNMHGFDPFRIPSAVALHDGARQAASVLARHAQDQKTYPESVALVLWGSDNLKSEGAPMAQALALIGARPRFDSYGRLCGAELIPLAELGRPRIDVVMTLSGICRDLLALQTKMLAEAAFLAASADEPLDSNYIRKHALALQAQHGCDLETAALRVFSNADGAYGANVNQMIENGCWSEEDELADAFENRKCYAYNRAGRAIRQSKLIRSILKGVDFTYQNLESVELGVTTIDHYVDALGGVSRAVQRARGAAVPVYIGDATLGDCKVRTLAEQVALETHTRMLNPRWYEGLLSHGYEGVRQIEAHVTNTMGWSATTAQVAPWIYQRISETYVLDEAMRKRLAALNPKASARMANRLLEAHARSYWAPDEATLDALRDASDDLEDHLEGIAAPAA
ncbi:MAG: magnesium chelatase subunit H [Alphaproteobacteria bacterium]|nr:magnesium chelatase subunit H [Alphaproteobacteria bacterium]